MTDIVLPASMANGNLARWLKREGDVIHAGDIIAEIETDKAMLELESAHNGVLAKILVPEGSAGVPVDAVIAKLSNDAQTAEKKPIQAQPQRIYASPRAKRLAQENGVDLARLQGSGPRGRIIEKDVLTARAAEEIPPPRVESGSSPAQSRHSQAATMEPVETTFPQDSYVATPHDAMRRLIATRLTQAKRDIPHFYLSVDCELDALLGLRGQFNRAMDSHSDARLSINDFFVKALALALSRVPEANVSWTESALLRHRHVDVSVAVAIPGGLITPIVKQAEAKPLSAISAEIRDLAARAKARKLRREEYEGGTTAISNLGMFGVKQFAAILNPPQATILAVGAGEQRVVVKNGQPTVATVSSCTLSVDHRAIDGAVGAELLRHLKKFIENPIGLFS